MIRSAHRLTGLSPLFIVFAASPTFAALIRVPDQVPTIAAAVAMASSGDEVRIGAGIYYEHDIALKSGITIAGDSSDAADVVIDAAGLGRIFWCEGVDSSTTIANLTLTGGHASGDNTYDSSGGAMLCSHSQPQITNCDFLANSADGHGGAVRVTYASPRFSHCRFIGNVAARGGGALDLSYETEPIVEYCRFEANTAAWGGAISARAGSHPYLKSVVIRDNSVVGSYGYGGGVYCDYDANPVLHWSTLQSNQALYGGAIATLADSAPWLGNCTVTDNQASVAGGGLYCSGAAPYVRQSIIAHQTGTAISCGPESAPFLECTDIFGNSGGDWIGQIADQSDLRFNLNADPLFCSDANPYDDSLTLQEDSPCAADNNGCGLIGAWEPGCTFASMAILNFGLTAENGTVQADWQLFSPQPDAEFRLEAARGGPHPAAWDVPYTQTDAHSYTAVDASPELAYGGTISYAIYARRDEQPWQQLQTANIELPNLLAVSRLENPYPNPFNPNTTITFVVSRPGPVQVEIYDLNGRLVSTLVDGEFDPGRYSRSWNATDTHGVRVSSGSYFVMMVTQENTDTQKLLLLK